MVTWVVPYIDQAPPFWRGVMELTQGKCRVYFPMPGSRIGSGRPPQPAAHVAEFLRLAEIPKSVLLNPVIHCLPIDAIAPEIIEKLGFLQSEYGVDESVVASPLLARRIRDALPGLRMAASVLTDITSPIQLEMLDGAFDVLTPSGRIMRDIAALRRLRAGFPGTTRLMVNEGCLPGCPFRVQHFYEMACGADLPQSLCAQICAQKPWIQLTGTWVLPQHLHYYEGLYDELKLDGRVTLQDPENYRRVLHAYIHREPLMPHEIGGGPASDMPPLEISDEFFVQTLQCNKDCNACVICRDYYLDSAK